MVEFWFPFLMEKCQQQRAHVYARMWGSCPSGLSAIRGPTLALPIIDQSDWQSIKARAVADSNSFSDVLGWKSNDNVEERPPSSFFTAMPKS